LPPVVAAPAFAIRKPAVAVFTLEDYVAAGIMTSGQASALKVAVEARKNILVAGGTSSGKTTLTNALLAEVAKTSDRVVLIEDTRELQCKAPNLVALRTKDGVISLSDLVRSSLRLRPDSAPALDSRALAYLKLDQPGRAIADYDAALRFSPGSAHALYGRSLAKRKAGDLAGAEADFAAAAAISPRIAEEYAPYGVRP